MFALFKNFIIICIFISIKVFLLVTKHESKAVEQQGELKSVHLTLSHLISTSVPRATFTLVISRLTGYPDCLIESHAAHKNHLNCLTVTISLLVQHLVHNLDLVSCVDGIG